MGTQEKLEKKVIEFFRENLKDLQNSTDRLIELGHLDKTLGFFKNFSLLCEEIQQDPRFTYMKKFLQIVEGTHASILHRIEELELMWVHILSQRGQSQKKKEKQMMRSKSNFYSQIDQIQAEFIDSQLENPENEFEHYLNKSKFLAKPRVIRKFTSEQEKKIKEFRRKATKEKLNEFQKPLSIFQELKLFDDYRLAIEYNMVDIEDKGWYNTVQMYINKWVPYLHTLESFHAKHSRHFLVKKIGKVIVKIEAWGKKVDKKYDQSIKLNMNHVNLMNQSIEKMISTYKTDRQQLKRSTEDKQILKYLN
jgi:hypothetical protein